LELAMQFKHILEVEYAIEEPDCRVRGYLFAGVNAGYDFERQGVCVDIGWQQPRRLQAAEQLASGVHLASWILWVSLKGKVPSELIYLRP